MRVDGVCNEALVLAIPSDRHEVEPAEDHRQGRLHVYVRCAS